MTDLEISKALALAIGWQHHQMQETFEGLLVCTRIATLRQFSTWRLFDYRDPTVIWPIAERYGGFPKRASASWVAVHHKLLPGISCPYYADTAAKAVALAVIGGAK